MSMITDLKDMVRFHEYDWGDLMTMAPFEYQTIKLLIIQDLQKEIENGTD